MNRTIPLALLFLLVGCAKPTNYDARFATIENRLNTLIEVSLRNGLKAGSVQCVATGTGGRNCSFVPDEIDVENAKAKIERERPATPAEPAPPSETQP